MITTGWIVFFLWITYWILWGILALMTGQRSERVKNLFVYSATLIFIPILSLMRIIVIKYYLLSPILPEFLIYKALGFTLLILGLCFSIWARIILGHNWSGAVRIIPGQKLVRTGPFKIVRHPIYLGMLVGLAGMNLLLRDVVSCALLIISILAFIQKSRSEEILLVKRFPLEYEQYKKEVKMFIPFLL